MKNPKSIEQAYNIAKEQYAELGIDTDKAIKQINEQSISMHCWQGDDVVGLEQITHELSGGIQTTGNYPGKARNGEELRRDIDFAMSKIPGELRLNLHANYQEADSPVDRNEIESGHFSRWVDWAKEKQIGLDFNPTCFSHPKATAEGTLSNPNADIRNFWIEHCERSRDVSEYFGKELGTAAIMNIWIPDGSKDLPADRLAPRARLVESLDKILSRKIDPAFHKVAVESKLFGIGAESYTVGSHEFYLGYAATRDILLCLDAGHFHPTEVISDKISSTSLFVKEMLLHVSRPVRWDSDHVVLLDDETQAIANEIVRGQLQQRVHIGLDFFDASINRIAAWVIGTRNMRKALLRATLDPIHIMKQLELDGDFATRLGLMEEMKSMPWSAVWDYYCLQADVPVGTDWFAQIKQYEKDVLSTRD